MGWTGYWATEYKNGKINRRAECRKYFDRNAQWGTLLKDAMVGSTWYGAVRHTETGKVFGMVMRTSVNGDEFCYKEMDETEGPFYYDCPESILKLLSPTDDERANEWRTKCKQRKELQKTINKARIIDIEYLFDTLYKKRGEIERIYKWGDGKWINCPQDNWHYPSYRIPLKLLMQQKITVIE